MPRQICAICIKIKEQVLRIAFQNNLTLLVTEEYHLLGKRAERRAEIGMEEELFEISATMVTVEVRDDRTGKVYRRELPIDYYETANFLKLSGENMDGSVSQIVFFTPRGVERVKDITGKGLDHDRCGGHGHE